MALKCPSVAEGSTIVKTDTKIDTNIYTPTHNTHTHTHTHTHAEHGGRKGT